MYTDPGNRPVPQTGVDCGTSAWIDLEASASPVGVPAPASTDQCWQWTAFTQTGQLVTSYYNRQYGDDETTGYSDVTLTSLLTHGLEPPGPNASPQARSRDGSDQQAAVQRVTSSSMPPPTQFGGVFLGDYTGLTADTTAHPLWMDTRTPDLFVCPGTATPGTPPQVCTGPAVNAPVANDQDIYTATVKVQGR